MCGTAMVRTVLLQHLYATARYDQRIQSILGQL